MQFEFSHKYSHDDATYLLGINEATIEKIDELLHEFYFCNNELMDALLLDENENITGDDAMMQDLSSIQMHIDEMLTCCHKINQLTKRIYQRSRHSTDIRADIRPMNRKGDLENIDESYVEKCHVLESQINYLQRK